MATVLADEMKNSGKTEVVKEMEMGDLYVKTQAISKAGISEKSKKGADGKSRMRVGRGQEEEE